MDLLSRADGTCGHDGICRQFDVCVGASPAAASPSSAIYFSATALPDGVAGRIVQLFGESEIQVNRALPIRFRAAVARHIGESHAVQCDTRACLAAIGWMRHVVELRVVSRASA